MTSRATESATDVVPRLLQRDAERLRRAVTDIDNTAPGPTSLATDLALHEARKKAKRLRYAGETAIPVFGSRATVLADAAKALQDSLGQHQDAVVARERLRELATLAEQGGESAFTFGRLHALEQARAEQAEAAFVKAWAALPHRKIRRWIRK